MNLHNGVPAMGEVADFRVGEVYTNDQVRFALQVENLGGIRPAVDGRGNLRHLAIMTATPEAGHLLSENPYVDRIESDVLLYTAQGRAGDQELKGRNRRLLEQYAQPVPFFGFQNIGRQRYRFLGLLEILRHYQEAQVDKKGAMRSVWLFELQIHGDPAVVPLAHARALMAGLLEARKTDRDREALDAQIAQDAISDDGDDRVATISSLEKVRRDLLEIPPYDFEHFVMQLMLVYDFVDVSVTPPSGDGGIDVNAHVPDENAFFAGTHVQVQVKRWRHAVGSIDINNFRGALTPAAKGVFLTTSVFTRAAVAEARSAVKPCISLIDGLKLSSLVVQKGIELERFHAQRD